MTFQLQWFTKRVVAAVAVALFVAPPALATDFRSPDTRDAASAVHGVAASVDLRSPDTRDAAGTIGAGQPASLAVDLRSPDTRDVASGRSPSIETLPVQITVVRPGDFDWSDAGIGAGAGAGLVLLVVGTSLLVRLGRTEARPA
jgi:hypothetical protein